MIFKSNYLHFVLILIFTLLLTYEFNNFIQTDNIITQNLSEKYTQEIIANYINLRHQWAGVAYLFMFIILYLSTYVQLSSAGYVKVID